MNVLNIVLRVFPWIPHDDVDVVAPELEKIWEIAGASHRTFLP